MEFLVNLVNDYFVINNCILSYFVNNFSNKDIILKCCMLYISTETRENSL